LLSQFFSKGKNGLYVSDHSAIKALKGRGETKSFAPISFKGGRILILNSLGRTAACDSSKAQKIM